MASMYIIGQYNEFKVEVEYSSIDDGFSHYVYCNGKELKGLREKVILSRAGDLTDLEDAAKAEYLREYDASASKADRWYDEQQTEES